MEEKRRHSDRDRSMLPIDQLDDIKVAKGDPDVRGWEVLTQERRRIGKVHTLIVDESAMTVRYLGIAIDKDLLTDRDHHHVLVPIGMARLDPDHDKVLFDEVAVDDLLRLPSYEHGPVTPEYESRVRDALMAEGATYGSPGYYEQHYFDRDRFYNRERETRSGTSPETRPRTTGGAGREGRTDLPR